MPLRDEFHPPLSVDRHWTSLHSAWATSLAADLNGVLPEEYFAEPNVHFRIEIDVATLQQEGAHADTLSERGTGPSGWTPPEPVLTIPFSPTTDIVEVAVYETSGGPVLVGAIELVSPANKDRPEHRDAFVAKCETLVQEGVGLVVVDVVTNRHANLHAALLDRLGEQVAVDSHQPLYASAYRPIDRNGDCSLEVWNEPLAIGRPHPTMPLWLRGGPCMAVHLDSTYLQMCRALRIPEAS